MVGGIVMSIEEKAKEYRSNTFGTPFSNDIAMAFSEGAKWMLEKAIYWLQEHVNDYLFDDGTPERPWLKCKSEMFDAFKKAMEE